MSTVPAEKSRDAPGPREVDDREVVVLLQRHHGLVAAVDVDVLRLRIVRSDVGEAGEATVRNAHASGPR